MDPCRVKLTVVPKGQFHIPRTHSELKTAITCVLKFLIDFHNKGFVHRDLRWPNVLKDNNGDYFVIDFEAAKVNEYVTIVHITCRLINSLFLLK